jgi:DNA-binding transcriptional MerR regulator
MRGIVPLRTPTVIAVPGPELLTTAQAASALGVSRRTLARYAERKLLTPTLVLPSGHYRWDLDDIRRQLRELRERGTTEG